MVNIVDANKEDSRSRSVRRALALAIPPVAVVVLVLIIGGLAAEMGWLKPQTHGAVTVGRAPEDLVEEIEGWLDRREEAGEQFDDGAGI